MIGKRAIAAAAFSALLLAGLVGFWLWQHPGNPPSPGPTVPPTQPPGGGGNGTTPAQGGGQGQSPGTSPTPPGPGSGGGSSSGGNGTGGEGGGASPCRSGDGGFDPPFKWGLLAPWHRDHASSKGQQERMKDPGQGHGGEHAGCHGKAHVRIPPPFGALTAVGVIGVMGPRLRSPRSS